jgi:hypothetical protein
VPIFFCKDDDTAMVAMGFRKVTLVAPLQSRPVKSADAVMSCWLLAKG